MRNLKKILALVLALVMSMSLVSVASADFADASEINNDTAVDVLYALGVIDGVGNNKFNPTGKVTRAQMAKMITIISLGDVDVTAFKGTKTDLTDVAGHWAEGYINYCYSQGIISGKGAGVFAPDANVKAAEAAKMLLVAIGYNAQVQGYVGTGDQWSINVARDAQLSGFYTDVAVAAETELTREQAAQMIYNAIDTGIVKATPNWNSSTGVVTYQYVKQDETEDLLKNTFGVTPVKGYLGYVDYNSTTKKFQYNIYATNPTTTLNATVYSTENFVELAGQKVEALYKVEKDTTKTAYGIYGISNTVSATVGELDLTSSTAKSVKLGSTTCGLNAAEADINVYAYANDTVADTGKDLDELAANYDEASALTLVDDDKDGKYNYALIVPKTVVKVSYVGTKSITAGSVYTFADNVIADGIAKNDFVTIVAAANSVFGKAEIAEVGTITGKIAAMKGTDIQVNGTWYKQAAANGDSPVVGNEVKAHVIGGYYYNIADQDGKTLDNVLMVLERGDFSTGLSSYVETKVMYAKDGSVATIKVNKVGGTTAIEGSTYATNGHVVAGAMYTFVEKDGYVQLTQLANDVIGSYDFSASGANFAWSATKPTANGMVIADDAVVMVYDDTNNKTAFITGKELKTWSANYGTLTQALYGTVNGNATVAVVSLYGTAMPNYKGNTSYGYVTGTTYYVKESSKHYLVMDIWTADGQLSGVKVESVWNANTSAWDTPTAAIANNTDTYHDSVAKRAYVTFEKLPNGNIEKLKEIGSDVALMGTYLKLDGKTELTFDIDALTAAPNADIYTRNITKDTVVIYIDSANAVGSEGGEIALAQGTTISGAYVKNAHIVTDASDVKVLFVDINNNLSANSSNKAITVLKNDSSTNVSAAIDETNKTIDISVAGTISITSNKLTTAANITHTGLAYYVNAAGATLAAGDTIIVVAQNGTSVSYNVIP